MQVLETCIIFFNCYFLTQVQCNSNSGIEEVNCSRIETILSKSSSGDIYSNEI